MKVGDEKVPHPMEVFECSILLNLLIAIQECFVLSLLKDQLGILRPESFFSKFDMFSN